jgi:hypothetical protein
MKKLRRSVLPFLVILSTLFLHPSTLGQDSSSIKSGRLALVGGVTLATVIPVHIYQAKAWWQGNRAPFKFQNDWTYAMNIDKWGHMYAGNLLSRVFGYSLAWSGLNEKSSALYGSILGLSYQMYVEVEDGFHKDYGFSPGDAFSNMIGATIPLAQATIPVLKNFSLKYSYWPSPRYISEIDQGQKRAFIDDYQGMTVWIAMDPHFLMGSELATTVPSWLGISFGIAARDLDVYGNGREVYYLTLDYNLSKIQTDSGFLRTLFTVVDFFHLPAPGMALDGGKFKVGFFYP